MSVILQALKKAFSQPSFVVPIVVLAVAAVSLNAATGFMELHFKKQPVRLAHALDDPRAGVNSTLGHWVQVTKDEPLGHEMQEQLGTEQYVFRDYVDVNKISKDRLESLRDPDPKARREKLAELESRSPDAVVHLGVTYYTGLVDTVSHIPDRCYIADGYQPTSYLIEKWPIGKNQQAVEVRFISFEDQTASAKVTKNVVYFFKCNDHFESDPIAVRERLQYLFEKYGYYAKVEAMTLVSKPGEASEVMKDFLASATPEVEKCLPDWNALHSVNVK
ncbi:MAG TPA: hypothetical protein VIL86_03565 [Tepidisphaeraceae bacterium]|jgi:hypothetical protein